jgi:hypothetical protein
VDKLTSSYVYYMHHILLTWSYSHFYLDSVFIGLVRTSEWTTIIISLNSINSLVSVTETRLNYWICIHYFIEFELNRANKCELTCVKPWRGRRKIFLPENRKEKINHMLSCCKSQPNVRINDSVHSAQGRNIIFETRMSWSKETAGTIQTQRN